MASPDFSSVLQLGSPGGYEPLRQYLLAAGRAEGVLRPGDDLMITSGCQQALDLVRRVLIRPGDKVLLEEPVYPGLKNLFLEAGAELTGIPVQADGMETARIERAMAKGRFKALVVTSNFQNPTGATLSREARESILRQAGGAGAVIVENDIYGQLRYEGAPLPTLKQMDDTGGTILLRSFSKISFPGLRVGWVTGPRAVIARMMEAKHLSDLDVGNLRERLGGLIVLFPGNDALLDHGPLPFEFVHLAQDSGGRCQVRRGLSRESGRGAPHRSSPLSDPKLPAVEHELALPPLPHGRPVAGR
jgi:2-aminoadipate transaminase